jgi:hypothetical protein
MHTYVQCTVISEALSTYIQPSIKFLHCCCEFKCRSGFSSKTKFVRIFLFEMMCKGRKTTEQNSENQDVGKQSCRYYIFELCYKLI